jgi:diguanylate cyclase (GGDEF)-like protein
MAAWGMESLVVVPIVVTRAGAAPSLEGDRLAGRPVLSVVGTLLAAAHEGVTWGKPEVDVLVRFADGVARRLETDELLRLQSRRIRELAGLARVATTVQSTVDSERLYSGFAQAMYSLVDYRRLYVARLDDAGGLVSVVRYSERGRPMPALEADADDRHHDWFSYRAPTAWNRAELSSPRFIAADDRRGIVVPLRPRGQVLGLAFLATEEAPSADTIGVVGQAVEQLALALDSAALYRQATDRAARIQVLGHLARIVASVADLREAFGAFADEVRWLIPFDRAVMMLVDEPEGMVRGYATYPDDGEAAREPEALAGTFAEVVLAAGGPVAFSRSDPRYAGYDWSVFGVDVQEVAAVPVVNAGQATAMFALTRTRALDYAPEEFSALDEVAGLLAVTIDRLRLYQEAEHNARHDSLTGLPNLRFLNEELAELAPALEGGGRVALMMADMDDLKMFNDTLGHEAGDRVIQIVGRELSRSCRSTDLVARVGGDEFVVLLCDADEQIASEAAERVHASLWDAHNEVIGAPTRIRISIGIATAPGDGRDAQTLLSAADQAMYEAKFAGGRRTLLARARRGDLRESRGGRRPQRLVEALVRAATAGASEGERAALLLAERYAVAAARRFGAPPEALGTLRMLVGATAASRLEDGMRHLHAATSRVLLEGLRSEWSERVPQQAREGERLADAAVALAWLMAPSPHGAGLDLSAALGRLHEEFDEDCASVLGSLEAAALEEPFGREAA